MISTKSTKIRITFFCLSALAGILFSLPWLHDAISFIRHNETYSYIQLIPVICGFFFVIARDKIFSATSYNFLWGSIALGLAAIVFGAGRLGAGSLSINDLFFVYAVSMLLFSIGLFIIFFGTEGIRSAPFPFFMMVFLLPIPDFILNYLVLMLQKGSAEIANLLFLATGTEFIRDGSTFHLSKLSIHVAPECSGIHSGLSLMITGIIAGQLFLRNKTSKILLCIAVIPIAIFKNGLRIATLTLLTVHVNPTILSSPLHRQGGKPFFILAMLFLTAVLLLLKRFEKKEKV